MNALENYKFIVENYFGIGSATFDTNTSSTNNIIGALNSREYFSGFNQAFKKRLERLSTIYTDRDSNFDNLIKTINEVSSNSNWEGAYSELVAFDFLNSCNDYLQNPIEISKTIPASETLASNIGMSNVNLDGYYSEFDIYFDVKTLMDKSKNILDSVIDKAKKQLGIEVLHILPQYPGDIDYRIFEKNFSPLVNELSCSINVTTKPTFISSKIISDLSYRIIWEKGVLMVHSIYDQYQHAENHHQLLFKHAKKFVLAKPTVIVFVVFPWFSERNFIFKDNQEVFFRSFSRRFFCQYIRAVQDIDECCYIKGVSNATITKSISSVIFLHDDCITDSIPEKQNIRAFAYLNPNATNKISTSFRRYLSSLNIKIDDFEHDNY